MCWILRHFLTVTLAFISDCCFICYFSLYRCFFRTIDETLLNCMCYISFPCFSRPHLLDLIFGMLIKVTATLRNMHCNFSTHYSQLRIHYMVLTWHCWNTCSATNDTSAAYTRHCSVAGMTQYIRSVSCVQVLVCYELNFGVALHKFYYMRKNNNNCTNT